MKRIKLDTVKPGDILFTARPGKISKLIRAATEGVVSHAMICVQHSSFIDSTSSGVQARNLQREFFDDEEQAFHFRLKNPPNQDVIEQIVDYARAEIGARYSIVEAARSVGAIRKPRLRRQFCSRLVARVYNMVGFSLVEDVDYCSPEDLRRSPLLQELPIEFETVSAEELSWINNRENPIQAMHDSQNLVLDTARSFDRNVENFNDIHNLLINHPKVDRSIASALKSSGYLDLWKMEVERHPWRYDHELIGNLPTAPESISKYCIDTIKEAYTGGLRFAINLVHLQAFQQQYPRKSFLLEIDLYKTLVLNDQKRREVAYNWLQKHDFLALKENMEQIDPNTTYWFSIVDRVEPRLAKLARLAVTSENSVEVCSSCGDQPAFSYRLVNGSECMPGVPSLRLCNDCIKIRRNMGNVLEPFLSAH